MSTAARTAILPCGGFARRLAIPFSKELLPVAPMVTAIDRVIQLILDTGRPTRIVVVVRREKTDIFAHLARYSDSADVVMIHQGSAAWDVSSAALCAAPLFGERNVVLLPDHVLRCAGNPVGELFACLETADVAYLGAPVADVPWATSAGLLKLSGGDGVPRVVDYAEHPARPEAYDVVWAALGFRGLRGEPVLRTMERAKRGERLSPGELRACGVYGAAVRIIDGFTDIGEWSRFAGHWGAR